MICANCGRNVSDQTDYCKGCGCRLNRKSRVKPSKITDVLTGYAKLGKKRCTVWQLCVVLLVCLCALTALVAAWPAISAAISSRTAGFLSSGVSATDMEVKEIDRVSGAVISPSDSFDLSEVVEEHAYSDGSWEKKMLIDRSINLLLIRKPTVGDEWVNRHVYSLFPDIERAERFPDSPDVSGWAAQRLFITQSDFAADSTIELLYTNDSKYDHMFIVEIPNDKYEDYKITIDRWMSGLRLIDAETGAEHENTADVSDTDTSSGDAE